ncbi:uncharacterized protein LOC121419775 isoform X1 [Lytechinus variegatus]|uniref:uncharacterized protein LOC121419775 isoform X1 n=1 Tax=Lytechinus variegatus TaxID=7654 RepID=UPI001BB2A1C6|nr:uncharacterized protein LOC121419775 isoform X1 [Lytechinus variegatus]
MDEQLVKKYLIGMIAVSLLGSVITGSETVFKVVLSVLVVFAPFAVAWYMNNTAEIRRLRKKIQDYRPGNWTIRDAGTSCIRPSKVRLGVFGVQDSGKSTFLNSLHFAYKGAWEQVYIESNTVWPGGETMFRDPAILTDQVITFDTRGLSDLSTFRVSDVMDEISGKRGINPHCRTTGERIDCPIFILKYNSATGIQHCGNFLSSLVPRIRQEFGSYPIMVVTFANSILNQYEIVDDITRAGMEKNSLFFIENYTALNHEMNSKKHIALLKILEACIKRADDTITFRWRKEKEPVVKPEGHKCKIM